MDDIRKNTKRAASKHMKGKFFTSALTNGKLAGVSELNIV